MSYRARIRTWTNRTKTCCATVTLPGNRSVFLQLRFDGFDDFLRVGLHARRKPGDDFAVPADQEFLEIPRDIAGELGIGLFRGEMLVQRALSFAFDDHFREHVELHAVVLLTERRDLGVAPRFLLAEL